MVYLNAARIREDLKNTLDDTIRRFKGRISLFRSEMGDAGFEYFREQLAKEGGFVSLSSLELNGCGLTDASIPGLCDIIRQAPILGSLQLQDNNISAKGMRQLLKTLQTQGKIQELYINGNRTGGEIGDAIGGFLRATPSVRMLNVSKMLLGDAGMRPILAAAGESKGLHFLYLSENKGTTAISDAMIDTLRNNPNLVRVGLVQGIMPLHDRLTQAVLQMGHPNLLAFFPTNDLCKRMTDRHVNQARKAAQWLQQPVEELSLQQKGFIATRLPAATSQISNNMKQLMYEDIFNSHLASLPALPKEGEGFDKALFKTNAQGYAPLDNPRLWTSPEHAESVLHTTPLTQAFLQRKTAHGADIITSAAIVLPVGRLTKTLNAHGVQLGAKELLDKNGKPNELLQSWIEDGTAAALFTTNNWTGKSSRELYKVYDTMPAEIRAEIPINRLRHSIAVSSGTQGMGR